MSVPAAFHADVVIGVVLSWLALGTLGLFRPWNPDSVCRLLFPLGGVLGVLLAAVALAAIGLPPAQVVLPLGLPDLPFHLRLDSLSAFFLLLLGATASAISFYSAGYFAGLRDRSAGTLCFQYHVFLASMALVLVADDAYFFMVAWETMALSSFFLVTTEH